MNPKTKYFYLIICIVSCIFASCKKTATQPESSQNENPEYKILTVSVDNFNSTASSLDAGYRDYTKISELIVEANKENKISEDERKQLSRGLNNKFVPFFVASSLKTLKSVDWPISELELIKSISDKLLFRLKETSSNYDGVKNVSEIVNEYYKAKQLCQQTTYTSIKNTQDLIAESKVFLNNKNLRYCQPLMKELSSLPLSIQTSHYNKIIREIKELDSSNTEDKNYFSEKSKQIENQITQYNSTAQEIYGSNKYYPELMAAYRNMVQKYSYLFI